jgi:dTDP-N-acetylfucosamine:lipid II N-acetylfucosaminyltransferase
LNSSFLKKIIHICEKSAFLEQMVLSFERVYPEQNLFLCDADGTLHMDFDLRAFPQIKMVSFIENEHLQFFQNAEEKWFLSILHNVGTSAKIIAADLLFNKVPIHGVFWGWEIYDTPRLNRLLYKKITRNKFVKKSNSLFHLGYKKWLQQGLDLVFKTNSESNRHHNIFTKLSSYSTILSSEVNFMRAFYGYKKCDLPFIYGIDFDSNGTNMLRNGRSILVGNSAAMTNNHLDLLFALNSAKNNIDRVVLPLSYGNVTYGDVVVNSYEKALGKKLKPLRHFIHLSDYNNIIMSCGFVVMGHIRQQAMSNIYSSLYQGAKVFLYKKSFAFKELTSQGYIVYQIEDLGRETKQLERPINIEHNRKLVKKHRGPKAIDENALRIVEYYAN